MIRHGPARTSTRETSPSKCRAVTIDLAAKMPVGNRRYGVAGQRHYNECRPPLQRAVLPTATMPRG